MLSFTSTWFEFNKANCTRMEIITATYKKYSRVLGWLPFGPCFHLEVVRTSAGVS